MVASSAAFSAFFLASASALASNSAFASAACFDRGTTGRWKEDVSIEYRNQPRSSTLRPEEGKANKKGCSLLDVSSLAHWLTAIRIDLTHITIEA